MTNKLLHVVTSFGESGVTSGLHTLIDHGFYGPFDDIKIVGLMKGVGSGYDDIKRKIGADHIAVMSTKEQAKPSKADLPKVFFKLNSQFNKFNPDVALLSLAYSVFVGRLVADFHPRVNVVSFEHSAKDWSPGVMKLLRATSGGTSIALGDTPETLSFAAQKYYRRPVNTYEVPLQVAERQTPRSTETPATFKLLSLGRLEDEKNYFELIRAVSLLAKEGYDLKLTIAGNGSLRPQLEKLVSEDGLKDRVVLPGFTRNVRALHDSAHIYVQPSLFEGQCLGVTEAMTAGMPVVATNVGGMRDYGVHGKNMIKISGFHARDIANGIRGLIDNYGALAPQMSAAAIDTMQTFYGEKTVSDKWRLAATAMTELTTKNPQRSHTVLDWLQSHLKHKPS